MAADPDGDAHDTCGIFPNDRLTAGFCLGVHFPYVAAWTCYCRGYETVCADLGDRDAMSDPVALIIMEVCTAFGMI